jgi:hypothetical protein
VPKLCNIDVERRKEILKELKEFVRGLKKKLPVQSVYLYGSFARGEIHEGSDIDLLIVADIPGRIFERIGKVLELTDLPIEPLVYTQDQFERMKSSKNPLIMEVLKTGKVL